MIVEVISGTMLALGSAAILIGAIGLLRFPEFFSRTHAASLTDAAGAGLMLLGLAVLAGFSLITVKLLFTLGFLLFTSPTASHALARAALADGVTPSAGEPGE